VPYAACRSSPPSSSLLHAADAPLTPQSPDLHPASPDRHTGVSTTPSKPLPPLACSSHPEDEPQAQPADFWLSADAALPAAGPCLAHTSIGRAQAGTRRVPKTTVVMGGAMRSCTVASSAAGKDAGGSSWVQRERWGLLEAQAQVEVVSSADGAATSSQQLESLASGCSQHRSDVTGGVEPRNSMADVTIDEDTDSGASLFCTTPVLTPPSLSSVVFSSDAESDDDF
jgi:hypothetical protein